METIDYRKAFGHDLKSAQELNKKLNRSSFTE